MIKKFLVIILVLCIIFMVGSIVFAGGDCDEGTPTPSEEATETITPSDETTPTPSEETTATPEKTTEKPSETITPSEEKTPEPSETSEVTNSPENTPGQETAQASVNPTSTIKSSALPKTGQGPNILIWVGGLIVLAGLSISIIFRKKVFS